ETSPNTTAQPPREQLTGEGVTLGTVSYMSPEQATGEELDARTDLFSLGVVLYECATGHPPFTGKTSGAILAAIIGRAPLSPMSFNSEIPIRLQDVINNALEKDRELRYQSAANVRADLKRVRRDLDSGRLDVISGGRASRASAPSAAGRQMPPERTQVINPAPVQTPPASGSQQMQTGSRRMIPIVAAVAVIAVVLLAYVLWPRVAESPSGTNSLAALSDATVRSRRDLAAQSLEARNYRAALAYASEVLAVAPDDPTALKIRDDSRSMIARFDAALEDTRKRAAAGDLSGAAQALESARTIDPTSPSVTELSARLADQLKNAPSAAASALRSRSATPSSQTPPPSSADSPRVAPPPPPAASTQTAPQIQAPPISTPSADVPAPPAPPKVQPAPASPAPQRAPEPEVAVPPPAAAPATAAEPSRGTTASAPAIAEDDDAAIRRVVAT